ncbi:MAG: DNA recombination protein RmuC [Methylomonas sp.]|nr:DNA recombination protein RmuC [Methylomonas sp.]PPD21866.1 MAG: DNA recombination protein RmuC [Methylomonas sp.]PPD27511.1 MAG: DNA recombination protein RmuC [Methylomonas sp.]PPD39493.1 MAG: DNA recombination protein RmuC [Methylomonas sp.]PPD42324.1 MAG: DNA recombination protein RmuC [Methylomonas sp.]
MLEEKLGAFQQEHRNQSEELRKLVDDKLNLAQQDARQGRGEMADSLKRFGDSQKEQMESLGGLLKNQIETFTSQLALQLSAFTQNNSESLAKISTVLEERLNQALHDARQGRNEQAEGLQRFGEQITGQLHQLMQRNSEGLETLRQAVEAKLSHIQADNNQKLEQMRQTVDEKLHNTLEQRLGESFKRVSEHLEQVHKGLGEMRTLASGVGDLKKVLSNVKIRGTWGEVQLDGILDQILSQEQYAKNVSTRPGSSERVEFAIKLPGRDATDQPVWLPIDAKFPLEDYQKLVEAQEAANLPVMEEASKALENRIKAEAKAIRDKYIEPPHTTDFGLLFLPIEGLYAEVIRRPGLFDHLQREYRVTVVSPTTLSAILNSLQMGFRTLAIEKRSSEVWMVLGAVKTEFGKFGEVLAKTKKKLDEARNTIESAEVRTRAIDRHLRHVEALPADESNPLQLPTFFEAEQ